MAVYKLQSYEYSYEFTIVMYRPMQSNESGPMFVILIQGPL